MSDGGPSKRARSFRRPRLADLLDGARWARRKASRAVSGTSRALLDRTLSQAGSLAAFLATPELLRWSESITGAASTLRDRALEVEQLRSQLGGVEQQIFQGRDLLDGWESVAAAGGDTLARDVISSVLGQWKDLGAVQGLAMGSLDRGGVEAWAETISAAIPGVKSSYLTDLVKVDSFEVLSAGLGSLAILLSLSRNDQQKLSEILGAMGITSIIAANPIMGLVVIAAAGYAYFKKQKIDLRSVAQGAAIAGVSAAVFATLGLPVLVELVIVIALIYLLRKHVLDNEELAQMIKDRLSAMRRRVREHAERFWPGAEPAEPGPVRQASAPGSPGARPGPWRKPTRRTRRSTRRVRPRRQRATARTRTRRQRRPRQPQRRPGRPMRRCRRAR